MNKILCIIPARGGSKGVKKKNIRLFQGKPLIAWTIEEALKSKYIDRVVVSTEDAEITETSRYYKAEVVQRPVELALDNSPSMDAILYSLESFKKEGYVPDLVVLLQCTSPLRRVKHIDESMELYLKNIDVFDSLISVTREEHPPWWLKKIDSSGCLTDFLEYDKEKLVRRQDFPEVFRQNGAIYIAKTEKLYEAGDFETGRTMPYIMDALSSMDIDDEIDFIVAEQLSANLLH